MYGNGIRRTVMTVVAAASAALLTTACQPTGGDGVVDPSSPAAPSASSPTPGGGAGTTAPEPAASPSAPGEGVAPGEPDPGSGATDAAAPRCAPSALRATVRQADDRPAGTGIGAMVAQFENVSGAPCVVQGHPTVAGAGNGSPERNAPMVVTRTGTASPVPLAPGGKAWLKMTFVQVQGEADGYCVSGSEPITYPTVVIGLPGSGHHQVAPEDVSIALCDNKVTVTPVSATPLS
ncbi:DUF4232 domain-containing protein [Streptomyces coeruleoprunus]|uniref:DUF4232 domain-containing protein n=1 Tax=Streptomyces coeruleoprunus TaxID=285563 RepID=A0ABV9XBW0_9ACTN